MNRTTLSLCAMTGVLAAVAGLATLTAPEPQQPEHGAAPLASSERKPVERTVVTCPRPVVSDFAKTVYTSFTPGDEGGSAGGKPSGGRAALTPAATSTGGTDDSQGGDSTGNADDKGDKDSQGSKAPKPLIALTAPGKPATTQTDKPEVPALIGAADGPFAPGYTVQQTTEITAGEGRGLVGTACSAPSAEFWFAAGSTAEDRRDYVHLTNPDDIPAEVDIELYGPDGALDTPSGDGLTVPAGATVPVLVSTLTTEEHRDLVVHVVARSGRVGAAYEALDTKLGTDLVPPSADSAATVVLPGLPKDTANARLVLFAPGDEDADLAVHLATPTGSITPAGYETLRVKSGMTTAVDLADITKGEPGSLLLTPASEDQEVPVVAGIRVLRGKGVGQEMAFIPATPRIEQRASAAGSGPVTSTLLLTAPQKAAKVRIVSTAASGGGKAPEPETVEIKAGATLAVEPSKPSGKGVYGVSVEVLSGGPVHAARMLSRNAEGVPMFTIQPMPDDRSTVAVPASVQDLAVLH